NQLQSNVILSAAVWRNYDLGKNLFMQDSHDWLKKGLVDYLLPMLYTRDNVLFRNELRVHSQSVAPGRIIAGINPSGSAKALVQVDIARKLGTAGSAIFSYKALFPNHLPNGLAQKLRAMFYRSAAKPDWTRSAGQFATFSKPSTWPAVPVQAEPFFVYVQLETSVSAKVRAFVEWKNPLQPLPLHPLPGQANIWLSPPIRLSDAEQWLECRVVGIRKEAPADSIFSDWVHIPVARFHWTADSAKLIGAPIGGAQFIAADQYGHLWIPAWWDNKIYVLDAKGTELPFSPITAGMDASNQAVKIYRPAGITCQKGDTMIVVGNGQKPLLMRFLASNGLPLPGTQLPFIPYDVASSASGELFVTEAGTGNWYHGFGTAAIANSPPPASDHLLRSIAVSPDGLVVYAVCQTHATVHQWQRLNAASHFSRVPDLDVEGLSIGCVDTDETGLLYVSHSALGFISVFSAQGVLSYVLRPLKPLLRGPRGVAVTPGGIFTSQMGGTTSLPVMRLGPPINFNLHNK
ncbi:MAG: hypothetical protein D6814_13195, partial [Calditrichaeota bacterium]